MTISTISKITGIPKERYIDVGSDGNYSTIEAAVDRITQISPDDNDPIYIRLIDANYNLSDVQLVMPANSGIIGASDLPTDHTITGLADRAPASVVDGQMIRVNSGNIFENFKAVANSGTGDKGHFASASALTNPVTFRNIITDQDGVDSFYLFGGGNYNFIGCDISTEFDAVAVFGSDATHNVSVESCYLHSTGFGTVNLIRVDNDNAVVTVDGCSFDLQPSNTITGQITGIGSGVFGETDVAYDLSVSNSQFRNKSFSTTALTHGLFSTNLLAKRTGKIDIDNCDFTVINNINMAGLPGADRCVYMRDVTNLTTGVTNSRVWHENELISIVQQDLGTNTVTGFPFTKMTNAGE